MSILEFIREIPHDGSFHATTAKSIKPPSDDFKLNAPVDTPLLASAPEPRNSRSLMPVKPPRPPPNPRLVQKHKADPKQGSLVFSMHKLPKPFKRFQNYRRDSNYKARYYDAVFDIDVQLAAFVTAIHTHVNLQGRTWENAEALNTDLTGSFRYVYWCTDSVQCPPDTLAFFLMFENGTIVLDHQQAYMEISKEHHTFFTPSFADFPTKSGRKIQAYFALPEATNEDMGPQIFEPPPDEVRVNWRNPRTRSLCQLSFQSATQYSVTVKTVYGETHNGRELASVTMAYIEGKYQFTCEDRKHATQVMDMRTAIPIIRKYDGTWPANIFSPEQMGKHAQFLSKLASDTLSKRQLAAPAPALLRSIGLIP